jgi:hypothetical protein
MENKPKHCKVCNSGYNPRTSLQTVCSFECSVKLAKIKGAQKEKKKGLEDMRTLSDYHKIAQKIFNTFIRMRDANDGCISCGTTTSNIFDSGHYRSVGGNPQLRYNEYNASKQCGKCNRFWGGNPIEYRKGLIKKYGIEIVEQLESDDKPRHYTIPELIELIAEYKQKIKDLKNDFD